MLSDGQESEIHGIQCGVPQGSILGPLLCILYMNDICNVLDIFFAIMYADDTSLVVNGRLKCTYTVIEYSTDRCMYMVQSKQTFIEHY